MKISVRWVNEYLAPGNLTPDEAQHVLTFAGFPIEAVDAVSGPLGADVCLDVEVTSNRGDVLSHLGVAREVSAATGRQLKLPAAGRAFDWGDGGVAPAPISTGTGGSNDVGALALVDNQFDAHAGTVLECPCPLFTARVIEGVKVGPSPAWLVQALAAIGQRSINNVVDITNLVCAEYGQPTHVFDLDAIQHKGDGKRRVIVRQAVKGEKLELLDARTITLAGDEVVVGDDGTQPARAISLAGVMGGALTQVRDSTTRVLLEAATWAPLSVRKAARRHQIRTDASYRFERIVDLRTIEVAARRAAALIVKLAGGRLVPGVIHAGREPAPLTQVRLRTNRCSAMLGVEVPPPRVQEILERLEIGAVNTAEGGSSRAGDGVTLACTIPAHRPDLGREVDLIEEVGRINGLDKLPEQPKLGVRVSGPQAREQAVRELGRVLTGQGFNETVTFTFVSGKSAKPFVPAGLRTLEVNDGRRSADPVLRPSAIPSLLACRRANQDRGGLSAIAAGPMGISAGGVRLFEISSGFAERAGADPKARGEKVETVLLTMIADAEVGLAGAKPAEYKQLAVRLMRGVLESAARALGGIIDLVPMTSGAPAGFDASAAASITLARAGAEGAAAHTIGTLGLVSQAVLSEHGVPVPIVAAELSIEPLLALYPPRPRVSAMPGFPAIERDLSLIVSEQTPWSAISSLVRGLNVPLLEDCRFIGTYRGPQAGAGKKSVTLRMRFRDPARTLRHEEVDPQVTSVVAAARSAISAETRG
jgi:phenylalanyl-tRNA synthetase beta chain